METLIYDFSANTMCVSIFDSVSFAIGIVSESKYLEFLLLRVRKKNQKLNPKSKEHTLSVLNTLSRGRLSHAVFSANLFAGAST